MTELMLGLPWLHPEWEMVLDVWIDIVLMS